MLQPYYAGLLGISLLALGGLADNVRCDWSRAKRAVVEAEALASLKGDGFSLEATGALVYEVGRSTLLSLRVWALLKVAESDPTASQRQVPDSGEETAGNPNTTYGLVLFPGSRRKGLLPHGYPEPPPPPQVHGSPFA